VADGGAMNAGRSELFVGIVATYQAPLARYLCGLVGDVELARDLTQETLLSAYRAWPSPEPAHLAAWLYRIATNQALGSLRRRKLLAWLPLTRLGGAAQPTTADPAEQWMAGDAVSAALKQLEAKERACLLLKAAGFSAQEIGQHLGCSEGAARMRLARAREAFRRLCEAAEGEETS
jgi:RNA polymerase sigma factor (sigma-70 family)